MVHYWSFMSLQHLRLYQDGYQPVAVHTHDDFIMLPHWDIRPWYHDPISYSVTRYLNIEPPSPCPILLMPSARLGKRQVSLTLNRLDQGMKLQSPTCEASAQSNQPPCTVCCQDVKHKERKKQTNSDLSIVSTSPGWVQHPGTWKCAWYASRQCLPSHCTAYSWCV